jgi:hypothetical protein
MFMLIAYVLYRKEMDGIGGENEVRRLLKGELNFC